MIIAVDFDGTIVDHVFPEIGDPVPGAVQWLKEFQAKGAKLILWTMRSDGREGGGNYLRDAVEYCRKNEIEFWGINENPQQKSWTGSPKAYANVYIDDAAFGCPLKHNPRMGGRPYVDWEALGPTIMQILSEKKSE